jgi:hypothetical protein
VCDSRLGIVRRTGEDPFDERALRVRVVSLAASACQFPRQFVVRRRGLRVRTHVVAKGEVTNPELAAFNGAMQMIGAPAEPRLPEIPTVWKSILILLDVFVISRSECRDAGRGFGQARQSDHDVDHRLCAESSYRRAPDVLDTRLVFSKTTASSARSLSNRRGQSGSYGTTLTESAIVVFVAQSFARSPTARGSHRLPSACSVLSQGLVRSRHLGARANGPDVPATKHHSLHPMPPTSEIAIKRAGAALAGTTCILSVWEPDSVKPACTR